MITMEVSTSPVARQSLRSVQTERIVCVFIKKKARLNEFAEACLRFTPQISVREGEAVFLEISRSLNLFTEETILLRLGVLAQRFGFVPQISVASDAPTALALAKYGCKTREELPIAALFEYASPFERNEELEKKARRMSEALQMLGLKSLQDFVRLPIKTMTSRFGEQGLEISRRVCESFLENLALVWPRFNAPEMISEKIELFEDGGLAPCADLEPLLFVIRGLADRVMARLRGRGLRLATLEIEADLDRSRAVTRSRGQATQVTWTMRLPLPQGSVSGLLPILRERLSADFNRSPLVAPVISICLRVIETAPGYATQKNLFNQNEEEAELLDSLVGRLCAKLGKERAFTARPVDRHLPERAWRSSLEAACVYVDNSVDIPERPARILKKPKYLEKKGDILAHEEKSWHVIEWQGPERISCEWWRDPKYQGFNRDYYRAMTHTGEELWVFSVPGRSGFYLHGYFD